jgi:lipoic acid synthetase
VRRPDPIRGEPALPPWIREKKLRLSGLHEMKARMRRGKLSTVCEEARCPNRSECFEVLTPDFNGIKEQIDRVADEEPDVYNHNVETVPRLYASVRPKSDFRRSAGLLARVKSRHPGMTTKSGLMLGLGETDDEVLEVLRALRGAGVDIVTVGQYLRPSAWNLAVVDYATPERFARIETEGMKLGFSHVFSGPFVRSSYRAEEFIEGKKP